jgi:ABC-type transporter Mla MlaB component
VHSHIAFAARPGEHACCRFASAEDRRLLTVALVRDATRRGYKVLYLCPEDDVKTAVAALAQLDETVTDALARGQMEVKPALGTYLPDGAFSPERMLDCLREEHAQALREGYVGLGLTGDMSWAFSDPAIVQALAEYEARLNGLMPGAKPMVLCQYDHSTGRLGSVSRLLRSTHDVDFPPELAPLAGQDQIAAARVMPKGTLRLAGELDFGCAAILASILETHFHGPLDLDLDGLTYVDVIGMRALRGRKGQQLTIHAASDAVRRLAELLAWDTDPDVEVAA